MIIGLITALIAGLLMVGGGLSLLRYLPIETAKNWHPSEHLAYAFTAGMTLWITLLIPLMLYGFSISGATLFIIMIGIPGIAGLRYFPSLKSPTKHHRWLLLTLFIWAIPFCIRTLLPNTGWDAAELHLPLGKLFLSRGNLFTHPVFYKFAITGGVQQIYGVFQFLAVPSAIIPFNFVAYLMTILLVYGWTNRHYCQKAAFLATGVLVSTSILAELAVEPRIDGFLALFAGVAFCAAIDVIRNPDDRGTLFLSAIAFGAGLATKYTMVVGVFITGGILLVRLIQTRKFSLKATILAVSLVCLPSAFWYLRNFIELNDPIYPFLIKRQYPDITGEQFNYPIAAKTREYLLSLPSEHPVNTFATDNDTAIEHSTTPTHALNIFDILLNPDQYTRKAGLSLSPLLLFFLGIPWLRRQPGDWSAIAIVVLSYLILATQSHLIRYMVLVVPLCAMLSGAVLAGLARRDSILIVITMLILVGCGASSVFSWQRLYNTDAFALLSGTVTEEQWMVEVGYNDSRELPEAITILNRAVATGEITDSDVLLMVGEGKGDRLKMHYIPDGSWNGHLWQYLWLISQGDPDVMLSVLKGMNVTYILFNPTLFKWVMTATSSRKQAIAFTHVTAMNFIQQHCTPVYNREYMVVGKINYPETLSDDPSIPNPQIPFLY